MKHENYIEMNNKSRKWNKGATGFKHSKEYCLALSIRNKLHPTPTQLKVRFKAGHQQPEEVKLKISVTLKCRYREHPTKTGNYQGGVSFEEYSPLFSQQLKDRIRVRDNFICQICGVPELETYRRLDIHHKDYDKKNNAEDNLISLCQSCHLKTNFNREKWIAFFKGESQCLKTKTTARRQKKP